MRKVTSNPPNSRSRPARRKSKSRGAKDYPLALIEFARLEHSMMDVVMLTIAFVFFALSVAYVYACDRL